MNMKVKYRLACRLSVILQNIDAIAMVSFFNGCGNFFRYYHDL